MLTRLKLSQFALVDSLDLELEGGLCLLTGETGAGKSILVEALSLLGGQRAETEMIRTGKDEALVEGTFDFTVAGAISAQNEAVASLLAGWGIVFEGDLVVRRKLQRSGRNSATVNGAGVTLAQLKELGALLFAIHGQHESQVLLDEDAHRNFLDSLPELEGVARTVEEARLRLHGAVEDLDALRRTSAEREARLALLRAQCEELGRIAPKTGEEGDLISERNRLQHAEQIAEDASAVADILRDSEAWPRWGAGSQVWQRWIQNGRPIRAISCRRQVCFRLLREKRSGLPPRSYMIRRRSRRLKAASRTCSA
ncbi:MAG: AAA family ATPase [Acidobacteriota bacterium]